MESINSNNYEAYFLDYLEGNLNAQQEFELMDFLDKHPALKAELDVDLGELTLQAEEVSLDKSEFKKVGIQPEEEDDLMIASVEGQLSLDATTELNTYVQSNNLTTDLKYYQNTLLKPNLSEGYGDVSDLKKKDHVFIPLWIKAAGAISVGVVIIGTSIYQFRGGEELTVDKNIQIPLINTDVESVEHNDVYLPEEKELSVVEELNNDIEHSNTFGSFQDDVHEEKIITPKIDGETDHTREGEFEQKEEQKLIVPNTKEDPSEAEKTENQKETETIKEGNEEAPESERTKENPQPNNSEKPLKDVKETKETIKSRKEYETVVDASVFKREVSWKREKDTESGEVVSHKIKLGKFEFERKKH